MRMMGFCHQCNMSFAVVREEQRCPYCGRAGMLGAWEKSIEVTEPKEEPKEDSFFKRVWKIVRPREDK